MLAFGTASTNRLATVVPELQLLATNVLAYEIIDFAVTDGRRSKERQNQYFAEGRSKVKWPKSRHNVMHPDDLAKALDMTPFVNGVLSYEKTHCCVLAGIVLSEAKRLGLNLRWGGNWDRDLEPVTDQTFQDLVHYELI